MNIILKRTPSGKVEHVVVLNVVSEKLLIKDISDWISFNDIQQGKRLFLSTNTLKCYSLMLTEEQKIEFELAFK